MPVDRRRARAQRLRAAGSAQHDDHAHDRRVDDDATPRYNAAAAQIAERVDALVIDDETPGVFVLRATARRSSSPAATTLHLHRTARAPAKCDTYQLRLTSPPTARRSTIALITDGQTDVDSSAPLRPTRITLEPIGGLQASQAFKGNDHDRRRRRGHDHARERLRPRQLPRRGLPEGPCGSGSPARGSARRRRLRDHRPRSRSVAARRRPRRHLPGGAHGTLAQRHVQRRRRQAASTISQLQVDSGVYTGADRRTTHAGHERHARPRTDGTSWLDSGFLEGQLIKIGALRRRRSSRSSSITGTGPGKTDRITLTGHPTPLPRHRPGDR